MAPEAKELEFYTTGKENKYKTSFGPTVSFASGNSYYVVGVAWGLNDKADDAQFHLIYGTWNLMIRI